jgi:hypothetical protein
MSAIRSLHSMLTESPRRASSPFVKSSTEAIVPGMASPSTRARAGCTSGWMGQPGVAYVGCTVRIWCTMSNFQIVRRLRSASMGGLQS